MGGFVYHVINRGSRRGRLFETEADYEAFENVMKEALTKRPIRLLNYCAMPNHFHLIAWPQKDAELPRFMHWLTATHAMRWRKANDTLGQGAVYQGRYRAIPVHTEEHFLSVARYVERNPVRAQLVRSAENWPWGSLWHRDVARDKFPLGEWPIAKPIDWLDCVNKPQTRAELAGIRRCVKRGCALGNDSWQKEVAKTLGIPELVDKRGRKARNQS
jgi:putative transposase